MITVSVTKSVYISPVLNNVYIGASASAETEAEATKIVEQILKEKEKEIRKKIAEIQRKCKHKNLTEYRHLDGSIGVYCCDCGAHLSSRNTLFGDDFLRSNLENFSKKFRCKICGKEFIWGEDDQDYCEHLEGKQPYEWEVLNLIEFIDS